MDTAARRAQLEAWIEASRRTRRRVAVGSAIGAGIGVLVIATLHAPVGAAILLGAVIMAICGVWITTGHLWSFRGQIEELEYRREAGPILVRQGRGRKGRPQL